MPASSRALHDPVTLIQSSLDEWGTPYVELDVFATDRAHEIVATVDTFCAEWLGSRLVAYLFYSIAYGARCTHSLAPDTSDWTANTWPYLLRTEGEALLGEATG